MSTINNPASSNEGDKKERATDADGAAISEGTGPASATRTTTAPANEKAGVNDTTTGNQTDTPATQALEWHAPILMRIDEHTTIPRLLKERVQRSATRPLILRKVGMGDTWRPVSAREFYDEVQSVAAGLLARRLAPGGRVATISRPRHQRTPPGFACWAAAPVPVPT